MANIKRLTKYSAIMGENDEPVNEFKSFMQEFDDNKNCLKEVEYAPNGEMESASAYKYNDQYKMIAEVHYFEKDEVGETIKYKLDEEGKPVEIETTYADNGKSIKKITRSESLLTVKTFDEDGEAEGEETIKYDNKNRPIEELQIDEDGDIVQRSVYEYDDSDQIINRTDYGAKDEFLVSTIFEYDNTGNMVKRLQLSKKGKLIASNIYEFDKNGNRILVQNNHHLLRTAYDDKNRIVSEETVNRSNNLVEGFTEYKYGDHDLVIEERTFEMSNSNQQDALSFGGTAANLLLTRYEYEFY